AQIYPGSQNKASGYYVSGGLFVTNRLELDLRYDVYDRLPNIAQQERVFKTWAIGGQYHITKFTRVMVDYFVRSVNIPNLSSFTAAQQAQKTLAQSVAGAADNEIAITAFVAF
ncbi:MAG: porin, partial [Acidithiobacillus sp.]